MKRVTQIGPIISPKNLLEFFLKKKLNGMIGKVSNNITFQ